MSSTFLVYCELGAASFPFKEKGFAGGFVTAVVAADDIFQAISLASKALHDDGYVIQEIDKVMKFEPDEWQDDASMLELVVAAKDDAGEVFYSDFNVYGH